MEMIIGVLLLITYLGFIVYAARGGNLLLGLFSMAVIWSILGTVGGVINWDMINNSIFSEGPLNFGPTAINIIFGSWFGRILVETGIASTIIKRAVELGGDKPALTTILIAFVTALIFTTAYGVGAVVAIGVIVFPILLSLGISKPLAAASFTMSVGCGLYFNSSLLNQAASVMIMPGDIKYTIGPDWYRFAIVAFVVHFISIIVMVIFSTRIGAKKSSAAPVIDSGKNVGLLACITPIIPVTISVAFGVSAIFAIILSALWAFFFTGNLKKWSNIGALVQKTFHEGVTDVGLVLGFLMFLQMFIRAAGANKDLLGPIVSPILPSSALLLFVVFGLLAFMSLFRGPLTIWGAGIATFAIIASTGIFPIEVLYPLFFIQCCTVTTNICPTQSWNLWAIGYTKIGTKEYMKQTLIFVLPTVFIITMVAYFMFAA